MAQKEVKKYNITRVDMLMEKYNEELSWEERGELIVYMYCEQFNLNPQYEDIYTIRLIQANNSFVYTMEHSI